MNPHQTTHGMTGTRTYRCWACMVQRCTNPRNSHFDKYGGRGITVCDRWRSFTAFYADMGECADGNSLDRIDPNGNYEPGNCRWATQRVQQRNRRDNVRVAFDGESLTLQEIAERTGLSYEAVRGRYRNGWPAHLLTTTPSSKSNSVLRKARKSARGADGRFVQGGSHGNA